jgi:hypothetical protein
MNIFHLSCSSESTLTGFFLVQTTRPVIFSGDAIETTAKATEFGDHKSINGSHANAFTKIACKTRRKKLF